jgi:hypothetical protein
MEAPNTAACGSIKGFATSRQLAARWAAASRPDVHTFITQTFEACRETGMRYASLFFGYHVSGAAVFTLASTARAGQPATTVAANRTTIRGG